MKDIIIDKYGGDKNGLGIVELMRMNRVLHRVALHLLATHHINLAKKLIGIK